MSKILEQLLAYNDHANRKYIEAVRQVRPASERVAGIFCHILDAHRIWNARVGGTSPAGGVWNVYPIETWEDRNRENFATSLEILGSNSPESVIAYRDLAGNAHESTIRDILLHVVNHSTYHRGQLAILFGQETKTPPVTDYIAYTREPR